MKNRYLISFILLVLFSCGNKNLKRDKENNELKDRVEKNQDTSLSRNEKILYENVALRYGEFIQLKNGYRILPVVLKEIYGDKGEEGERLSSNLLIIDKNNNVTTLDSLGNWYIKDIKLIKYWPKDSDFTEESNSSFDYELVHDKYVFEGYVLLTLETSKTSVSKDNLKKEYNIKQQAIGILNETGGNFTVMTPNNSQVENIVLDANSNSIYISVITNINADEYYNDKDPLTYYAVSLENGKIVSRPLISNELEVKLKKEYLDKLDFNQ